MIAILAALPREIAGLTKGFAVERRDGISLCCRGNAVIVAGGMGAGRVTLALEAALARAPIDTVVSVGLAGSCNAAAVAGSVVEAGVVIDARTGERYSTATPEAAAVLVTAEGIAGVHEKARLASSYGASMVDMEAATLARLADARGIRFRAIKGISDPFDFEMASLSRFEGKHGTFRTGAFALHTAARPHRWRHAMQLGKYSSRALTAMQEKLRVEFELD